MQRGTDGHTYTEMAVATIHFASSTTHAKYNKIVFEIADYLNYNQHTTAWHRNTQKTAKARFLDRHGLR